MTYLLSVAFRLGYQVRGILLWFKLLYFPRFSPPNLLNMLAWTKIKDTWWYEQGKRKVSLCLLLLLPCPQNSVYYFIDTFLYLFDYFSHSFWVGGHEDMRTMPIFKGITVYIWISVFGASFDLSGNYILNYFLLYKWRSFSITYICFR